ncbi:nucleolar RNA helicase II [Trypanosoma cruzi]|uniref:Nucleolar RNA helicase II n=1 Tax=Trypanosoma cruzi TaxID=5693 RepID=A0A7J6XXU2_TRYCR|nr:nucleolar RNA helicase II [Trypanosoma cruzi]
MQYIQWAHYVCASWDEVRARVHARGHTHTHRERERRTSVCAGGARLSLPHSHAATTAAAAAHATTGRRSKRGEVVWETAVLLSLSPGIAVSFVLTVLIGAVGIPALWDVAFSVPSDASSGSGVVLSCVIPSLEEWLKPFVAGLLSEPSSDCRAVAAVGLLLRSPFITVSLVLAALLTGDCNSFSTPVVDLTFLPPSSISIWPSLAAGSSVIPEPSSLPSPLSTPRPPVDRDDGLASVVLLAGAPSNKPNETCC